MAAAAICDVLPFSPSTALAGNDEDETKEDLHRHLGRIAVRMAACEAALAALRAEVEAMPPLSSFSASPTSLEDPLACADTSSLLRPSETKESPLPVESYWTRTKRLVRLSNLMLIFSILWQATAVAVIHVTRDTLAKYIAIFIMVLFQLVQLGFVVVFSIRLARSLNEHPTSWFFLAESFLSTTLAYAGVYTLLYQIDPRSFSLPTVDINGRQLDRKIYEDFGLLLYFSATTMTTVGFGDVFPTNWYAMTITVSQQLLSVLYSVVIFSQGMNRILASPPVPTPPIQDDEQVQELLGDDARAFREVEMTCRHS